MPTVLQRNALRVSFYIICVIWLWQILSFLFPHIPFLNFFLPKVDMQQNMRLAAIITLTKGMIFFLLSLSLLRLSRERLIDLGFRQEQLIRQVTIGALFGLSIFIFNSGLLLPFIETLFPKFHVSNSALFSSKLNIAILFFLGIIKGGFLEESWRIFALTRLEKVFQKTGLMAALIISSIVFGLGHAYQGNSAIIGTAVIGLLNGLVYLRKRNAFEAVAAHATFDILAVAGGALMSSGH